MLGRTVGREPGETRLARGRGDVDDHTTTARLHPLDGELAAPHDSAHVDIELALDGFQGFVIERGDRHDARVVHDHVDRSHGGRDGVEEGLETAVIGDIERQADGAVSDLSRGVLAQFFVDVADGDLGARSGECRGDGPADAPCSAGDGHDLARELYGCSHSSSHAIVVSVARIFTNCA
ncbi:Uncharacterised protein [Mycobacteroides abscessus subsp. massiliense]|nr:Uncharacterised protein [Mycobacteroides abscessus subsp. massiliense]